jgi:hypothetical protein
MHNSFVSKVANCATFGKTKFQKTQIRYLKLVVFPFKFCDAAIVVTFQNIFSLIGDTFVEDH